MGEEEKSLADVLRSDAAQMLVIWQAFAAAECRPRFRHKAVNGLKVTQGLKKGHFTQLNTFQNELAKQVNTMIDV